MMGDTNASMGEGLGLEMMYPVGSIYMNLSNNANPRTIFGFGTWQALDEGRVLLGANATYSAGSKGGESAHTLTTQEMPSHGHSASASNTNLSHKHGVSIGSTENVAEWYAYDIDGSCGGGGTNVSTWERGRDARGSKWEGSDYKKVWHYSQWHSHDADMDYQLGDHSHDITVNNSGGGGAAHNIMQPYLSVYMWVRVE